MKKTFTAAMITTLGCIAGAHAETFSNVDICKAAISLEKGLSTMHMRTKHAEGNPEIWYQYDENSADRYRCRVDENVVSLATYAKVRREWTPWASKLQKENALTTYSESDDVLTLINHKLGEKNFTKEDF